MCSTDKPELNTTQDQNAQQPVTHKQDIKPRGKKNIYLKASSHCSSQGVKQRLSYKKKRTHKHSTDLQTVFEAVGRRLVAAVAVLLPALAQQQGPLVQEEVALHGLEASQLLHAGGTPLVAEPHAEGALHQHAAQLTNVALPREKRSKSSSSSSVSTQTHNLDAVAVKGPRIP